MFDCQRCGRGGIGQWAAHPPEFEQVDKKRFWPLGNGKDQRRRGHPGLSCQQAELQEEMDF